MSTRFENKLILPRGAMGPTTLLELTPDDLASVERWHRREWDQFRNEVVAYKNRILEASRSAYLRAYDRAQHCEKCRQRRASIMLAVKAFKGPRRQRGILQLAAGGTMVGAASGDCSFTASTIPNLFEFNIEPTNSYTQARLHQDGDWYSNASTNGAWGGSDGTWDGDCAIADYDSRWNRISGTVPNANTSNTDGNWAAANTAGGSAVGYNSNFGVDSGSFNLELRDGTSLNVLFTDSFTMNAEVDARN